MKKILYEGLPNSGKTNLIKKRVQEFIKSNKSLLILDTKKEYEEMFSNTDYEIVKFDISDIENSVGYNPLISAQKLYKKGNVDSSIDNIKYFGNVLFKSKEIGDPFWDNSAKSMFIGICLYILENKRDLSLKEIIKVSLNEIQDLKDYVNKQDVLSTINIILSNVINAPKDTKESILSVFEQKIQVFAHKPNLLNKISFNNDIEIHDKNQVILLTNFNQKTDYNLIIECAIINLINEMIESKNEYTIILDNYDSIINHDEFNNLFNSYLSDNIECIVGVRDKDLVNPLNGFIIMNKEI